MAFKIGFGTLNPGTSIRWGVTLGGDKGVQIVMAHPETPGEVVTSDPSIVHGNDGTFYYKATFKNPSSVAVSYTMQGGGVL